MSDEAALPSDERLPADKRLVVIQRNPTSGTGRGAAELKTLIRQLRRFDFRVRLFASRERLDEFVGQPNSIDQLRCIVAAGGDGTVADVLNRHPNFPIATFPMGTENLLARYLKVRRNGAALATTIREGLLRRLDVGHAGEQSFLMMFSSGVDADVVRRLHAGRRGNIGHLSYLLPTIRSARAYSFPRISVWADGEQIAEGTHVIATNIPMYGGGIPFSPDADPTDGLLDVRVFDRNGFAATIKHALVTRMGAKDRTGEVQRFQLSKFEMRSEQNAPTQADGDPSSDLPVKVTVQKQALTIVGHDKT